ncbi:SDR family NAD(P)-dependent oxidoreductase [Caballeronia sp. LjRoot31]|uniref:SDR family NAD(P)-dependent oxidoreductase n=1 Tax=Caballeronia sp. LjRoot31 TaxID=3342324 RepID=UPI003ECFE2FA
MSKLQGKIAIVTGGNSGIGLAIARRFIAEGAFVYVTGRRLAELEKVVSELGDQAVAVQGDVANVEDIDRLYAKVRDEKGRVDIVVANAGIVGNETLEETTVENFDQLFAINARGVLFTVKQAIPLMSDGGAVIAITSMATAKGIPGYSAYSATKAAVRSFVRTWTAELKSRGIRVNAISPGPIDTPILDTHAPNPEEADKLRTSFAAVVPLGRLGKAEEIAAAALFLASDEASFVAGVDLPVDGGVTAVG